MSKFFKGLKKAPKAPTPRTIEVIQNDYNRLKGQAGEIQYQIFALTQNLESLNRDLVAVNHEAAARQKLDREATPAPKEESKNE